MGIDYTHAHAAALFVQLPQTCRSFGAVNADSAWDEQLHLLNSIDYSLRVIAWQRSKDGEKGRNAPKPPKSPSQRKRERDRIAHVDMGFVKRVLEGGE